MSYVPEIQAPDMSETGMETTPAFRIGNQSEYPCRC